MLMWILIIILLLGWGCSFYLLHLYYKKQLRKEIKRAQKSERLKSVFLDNVSHALRTPLNAILGYSSLILEEQDANLHPKQVKDMATHIHKNTQQLTNFVKQLLELSGFEGDMPTFTLIQVNLAELMASYRREALNFTKSDVSVRLRTGLSPHCKVLLDTNLMHQIMMHLLKNAASHTSEGDITINYGDERKGLKVTITYTGNGQSQLISEDIFSFLQNESDLSMINESSALSLSICKSIIDSLEGELDIDTENNGRKTVASFWFPCKMVDLHKGQ